MSAPKTGASGVIRRLSLNSWEIIAKMIFIYDGILILYGLLGPYQSVGHQACTQTTIITKNTTATNNHTCNNTTRQTTSSGAPTLH